MYAICLICSLPTAHPRALRFGTLNDVSINYYIAPGAGCQPQSKNKQIPPPPRPTRPTRPTRPSAIAPWMKTSSPVQNLHDQKAQLPGPRKYGRARSEGVKRVTLTKEIQMNPPKRGGRRHKVGETKGSNFQPTVNPGARIFPRPAVNATRWRMR